MFPGWQSHCLSKNCFKTYSYTSLLACYILLHGHELQEGFYFFFLKYNKYIRDNILGDVL